MCRVITSRALNGPTGIPLDQLGEDAKPRGDAGRKNSQGSSPMVAQPMESDGREGLERVRFNL